jgi:hypothetical protein
MGGAHTALTMKDTLEMLDAMRTLGSLLALGLLAHLAACTPTGGWQGAASEKMYDFNLEAQRAAAVLNNDDYYEIHKDGRIYVLADVADVKGFNVSGEIPLRLTRIGGGPKGETVVFGIARPESKKKEGFGAVEMYDFKREGATKVFYAEIVRDNRYYLFGDWASLAAFRKSGSDAGLSAVPAKGPNGEAVLVAGEAATVLSRFKALHGG